MFALSHNNDPDNKPGDVVSLTSIPPFAAPLPLSEIMLSEISTVVELTLVSVPLTNKLPLIVTFEPVNSTPLLTVVWNVSKLEILVLWDPLVTSNESTLPSKSYKSLTKEPVFVSNEDKRLSCWVFLVLLEDVWVLNAVLIEPDSVSNESNLSSWPLLVLLLDDVYVLKSPLNILTSSSVA